MTGKGTPRGHKGIAAEPPRIDTLDTLATPFFVVVVPMVMRIQELGLPLRLFETRRSIERQDWLYAMGVSRARGRAGPHCWGLAVDFVLDTKSAYWGTVGETPRKTAAGGAPWDTGLAWNGSRCVPVRAHVLEVWQRYGTIALDAGLDWGGVNAGPWRSGRRGDVLGWDPSHVQMRNWRAFRSKGA